MILVLGGSGSGKSAYAEERIKKISLEKRLPVYYVATMKVYGAEEEKIVERHKQLRAGKGFFAVEQPTDLCQVLDKVEEDCAVILECLSNLCANEMFNDNEILSEDTVVAKICDHIKGVNEKVKDMVVVSNNIFDDGVAYDETTLAYIRALGRINRYTAQLAEEVWETVVGIPVQIK